LQAYLEDPDESVRVNAAAALAMLGSDAGEAVLLAATESGDPQARREATYALGYLDSLASVQRLWAIASDPRAGGARKRRWRSNCASCGG
jgi:HEAT repeat protein